MYITFGATLLCQGEIMQFITYIKIILALRCFKNMNALSHLVLTTMSKGILLYFLLRAPSITEGTLYHTFCYMHFYFFGIIVFQIIKLNDPPSYSAILALKVAKCCQLFSNVLKSVAPFYTNSAQFWHVIYSGHACERYNICLRQQSDQDWRWKNHTKFL